MSTLMDEGFAGSAPFSCVPGTAGFETFEHAGSSKAAATTAIRSFPTFTVTSFSPGRAGPKMTVDKRYQTKVKVIVRNIHRKPVFPATKLLPEQGRTVGCGEEPPHAKSFVSRAYPFCPPSCCCPDHRPDTLGAKRCRSDRRPGP